MSILFWFSADFGTTPDSLFWRSFLVCAEPWCGGGGFVGPRGGEVAALAASAPGPERLCSSWALMGSLAEVWFSFFGFLLAYLDSYWMR